MTRAMRQFSTALSELLELQRRIDDLFAEARAQRERLAAPHRLVPRMDVSSDGKNYYFRLDLPGVDASQVRVVVDNGAVIVRGEKPDDAPDGARVLRRERSFGDFVRSITLPSDANPGQVEAEMKDGVLTIKVARLAPQGPREVPVKSLD